MLFKEKPWGILDNHPHILNSDLKGIYALSVSDPFLERIYQSRVSQFVKETLSMEFHVLLGKELTIEWVEDNLLNPGLFSNNCCYLVLNSEEVSDKVQELLLNNSINISNSYLLMSFLKNSKFFKKLSEKKTMVCYLVEPVMFWEFDRLLDFFAKEIKVQLNLEIKKYLLDNIENESGSFINALKIIKLNSINNIPTLKEVSKLIPPNKIDFFVMATLYSKKQKKEFFAKLLESGNEDFNWHQFISFMIGHFIKMLDTSTLSSTKPYERDIINFAKLWTKEELVKEIKLFGDLQTEAKIKKNLKEKLRLCLLESN
jgi:hypothetical protein